MKTRVISLLIALCLIVGLFPAVSAETLASGTCGDSLTWQFERANGTLTISGQGPMPDYATGGTCPWSGFGDLVTRVEITEGVTSIGASAFYQMTELESVTIPEGVVSVGSNAFYDCSSLERIEFPASLESIADSAFNQACIMLEEVVFHSDVPAIGENAFAGVFAVAVYPAGNRTWTEESMLHYGGSLYWHSSDAADISASGTCGESLTWSYDDHVLTISGTGAMDHYDVGGAPWSGLAKQIHTLALPDGLTGIGSSAFTNCIYLTDVTIPDTVSEIGSYAFQECRSLTQIAIPDQVTTIGRYTFDNCTGLTALELPDNLNTISGFAFNDCEKLEKLELPESTAWINDAAFSGCHSLTEVTIPKNVEYIGNAAFSTCFGLKELTIEASAVTMISFAFSHCVRLESVRFLGDAPSWSGDFQFYFVNAVAYYPADNTTYTDEVKNGGSGCLLWLPDNGEPVTASGTCGDSLTWEFSDRTLTISGSGEMQNWSTFFNVPWSGLQNMIDTIVFSGEITSIGEEAFHGCNALTSLTIPEGITTIGEHAFMECCNLEQVSLPASLTNLSYGAFRCCTSLKSVELPAKLREIGSFCFAECTALEHVSFPDGLQWIWGSAFFECTSLTSIELQSGVRVREDAFEDCLNLSEIRFLENGSPYIDDEAFSNVIATAYYPAESVRWEPEDLADYGGFLTWEPYSVGVFSGSIDEGLTWTVRDKVLTISGSGTMQDFASEGDNVAPWYPYRYFFDTIVIEDGIRSIGDYAFQSNSYVKSVTIPDSVTAIGDSAFESCAMEQLDIPEGVKEIGTYAFAFCSGLDVISFPSTLESVGNGAFEWTFLSEVHIPSMRDWMEIRFGTDSATPFSEDGGTILYVDDVATTDIVIPDGITEIGPAQFQYYDSITSVQIPDSVTSVGEKAFQIGKYSSGAPNFTEITFPASVSYIGPKALCLLDKMEHITVLNPDCVLSENCFTELNIYFDYENEFYVNGEVWLYGYSGSTAQAYAEAAQYTFVPLNPFTDVPAGSFFYEPVMWAIEKGITNGLSATEFGPVATCNRAQVVTFLWRAAGSPEPTSTRNPFVDVAKGSFYEKPVLWAVEKGITNGSDATHFGPTGVCNRAQVVTFLYRAFGSPAVSTEGLPFTDVPAGSWYEAPIAWAVANGITNGLSATEFGPVASCNRAQVVTFLYRAYND